MKKLFVHIGLLVSIITLLPFTSFSQWEMSLGLDGGEIPSMVSIDSMLFAISADRGIYSKSDTGHWELSHYNKRYRKLINAGNCVFAYNHTFGDNPIRSLDYGNTWENVSNLNSSTRMLSIDTVLFFGPYYSYRSFDFGATYDTIQFPIQDQNPLVLCDDSLLYVHYDLDEGHHLFYSADLGDTWDSIPANGLFIQPFVAVKQLKYLNGTFWAQLMWVITGYAPNTVFVFNDELSSWFEVTNNLPNFTSHNDLFEYDGKILCSINSYPVFRFNYADSSWVQFADASKEVNKFLLHNDELFCATDQGPCLLDTSGNWTTYYTGLHHRNISSIDVHGKNIYVTANNELFYSEDGGNNFTRNENAYGFQIITTDTVFYMISTHEFRVSWDQGDTWHSYSDSLEDNYNQGLTHLSISPDYYYIGTWRGLFRSPSDSIAWEKAENGPFNPNFIVYNVEAIENTVMVGEYFWAQKLYFSDDNGISFYDYDEYSKFRKVDQSYFLLKDTIFFSDDLGQTWDGVPFKPISYFGSCVDRKGDTIIVGGRDVYAYPITEMTYDNGENWIDLIDDLPVINYEFWSYIPELKIIDGRIFVGNPKHGLWYRDDILTHTSEKPTLVETDNISIKVYPNPLSSVTNFQYTLQQFSTVNITIYDHFGEQVDAISQNQLSGKQQVLWSTDGLPSGIYFFTFKAGKQSSSGKMVIVK